MNEHYDDPLSGIKDAEEKRQEARRDSLIKARQDGFDAGREDQRTITEMYMNQVHQREQRIAALEAEGNSLLQKYRELESRVGDKNTDEVEMRLLREKVSAQAVAMEVLQSDLAKKTDEVKLLRTMLDERGESRDQEIGMDVDKTQKFVDGIPIDETGATNNSQSTTHSDNLSEPGSKRKRSPERGEAASSSTHTESTHDSSLGNTSEKHHSPSFSSNKRSRIEKGARRTWIRDPSKLTPRYIKDDGRPYYGPPPSKPSDDAPLHVWEKYFRHPGINAPIGAVRGENGLISTKWLRIHLLLKAIGPSPPSINAPESEHQTYGRKFNQFRAEVCKYASVPGYLDALWVKHGLTDIIPTGPKAGHLSADLSEFSIVRQLRLFIDSHRTEEDLHFWARTRRNFTSNLPQDYCGDYGEAPNQQSLINLIKENENRPLTGPATHSSSHSNHSSSLSQSFNASNGVAHGMQSPANHPAYTESTLHPSGAGTHHYPQPFTGNAHAFQMGGQAPPYNYGGFGYAPPGAPAYHGAPSFSNTYHYSAPVYPPTYHYSYPPPFSSSDSLLGTQAGNGNPPQPTSIPPPEPRMESP